MTEPFPSPTPEICTCSALRQAARHVTRLYDEALRPVRLSLNQYSILAKLERSGPMMIQDLAALLVMDRSTVGHLLRPLGDRGLVALETPKGDRRSRLVALTPAGRALMQQARPLWATAERRFGQAFGPEAASDLRLTLKRVALSEFAPPGSH